MTERVGRLSDEQIAAWDARAAEGILPMSCASVRRLVAALRAERAEAARLRALLTHVRQRWMDRTTEPTSADDAAEWAADRAAIEAALAEVGG